MWERFSFYGMKALLLLYLIEHHKFGDRVGLRRDRRLWRTGVLHAGVRRHARRSLPGHAQGGDFRRRPVVPGPLRHGLRGPCGGNHQRRRGARRGRAAGLLPVAGADHHGRRLPQAEHLDHRRQAVRAGRSAPRLRLFAVLRGHQPRRPVRIHRLRLPGPDPGLELGLRRRRYRHGRWVSCSSCGARNTCTVMPNHAEALARRVLDRVERSMPGASPACCRWPA